MDFVPIINGFAVVFEPSNLFFCLAGVTVGMLVGVLPGLGPVATISILLPITYALEPTGAIIMLAGIFYGAQYGGTITSVLLSLPGETTSVVTTFDGYQMAKQGRAGSALGIAAVGSFVGGTVSIIGLTLVAPLIASFALQFGPAEYTGLTLLGILLVSTLGTGSAIKCIAAALLGLLLATVGQDPFAGVGRFDFGSTDLAAGLDFVPIAMGLFGLGEILHDLERRARSTPKPTAFSNAWIKRVDWIESKASIARGTVLGFIVGVLPGGGATISSMLSYAVEKRLSKTPEKFGKGAIQGVAGPETANNSAATSSFIPLLTLGIPANATMAVIFGALLIQGITPGPRLIQDHPETFWGVVNSMWVGNIFLLVMSIPLVGLFVRIMRIRITILAPITVLITMVGVYTVNNSVFDMFIVVVFGVIGFLLKKFGFEPGPLVLAFVLGSLFERSFRQSLLLFDGNLFGFFGRPISASVLVLTVLMVAVPVITRKRKLAVQRRELDRVG
ncbi:tripartite tricarboxylate transporter permease [Arthrobacter sp. Z4-13]